MGKALKAALSENSDRHDLEDADLDSVASEKDQKKDWQVIPPKIHRF